MTQVDWRHVTPQYDEYSAQLEQFPDISPFPFSDIQHRFRDALTRFVRLSNLSRVLLVNAQDNSIYRQMIVEYLVTALDNLGNDQIHLDNLKKAIEKDKDFFEPKSHMISYYYNKGLIATMD